LKRGQGRNSRTSARTGEQLAQTLGEFARFVPTDVAVEADVKAMIEQTIAWFGRIDCVVNNAGTGSQWVGVAEVDALAAMKHAVPIMAAQGSGSIITVASVNGVRAGLGGVAKAAAIHLTRCASALPSRRRPRRDLELRSRHSGTIVHIDLAPSKPDFLSIHTGNSFQHCTCRRCVQEDCDCVIRSRFWKWILCEYVGHLGAGSDEDANWFLCASLELSLEVSTYLSLSHLAVEDDIAAGDVYSHF
jgi:hypothetical protein